MLFASSTFSTASCTVELPDALSGRKAEMFSQPSSTAARMAAIWPENGSGANVYAVGSLNSFSPYEQHAPNQEMPAGPSSDSAAEP
jgi:hypothetical protein